jgi:hypothetical protein
MRPPACPFFSPSYGVNGIHQLFDNDVTICVNVIMKLSQTCFKYVFNRINHVVNTGPERRRMMEVAVAYFYKTV